MPTKKEYVSAILAKRGLVSQAAEALGVSRQAVYKAAKKHTEIQEAIDSTREETTDFAESKLYEQIAEGNITAIIFYLKTQGKKRGYVERQEVQNTGDLKIEVVYEDVNSDGGSG